MELPDLPVDYFSGILLKYLFFNIGNHLKSVISLTFNADVHIGISFEHFTVFYIKNFSCGFLNSTT